MNAEKLFSQVADLEKTERMPVFFVGHGHPINAIADNSFTRHLAKQEKVIPKPKAILMISAHWLTRGTYVSVNPTPETIYDFGRFDDRLFKIKYPAKGSPQTAKEVINDAANSNIKILEDIEMGLDHGAWTILKHLYPLADIPVFQMSIDYSKPIEFHYQLGQKLQAFRDKGILIIGSGNVVHNLYDLDWYNMNAKPIGYSIEFDNYVKTNIDNRNFDNLIHYQKIGALAQKAHPTNDHYLPLLYTLGASTEKDTITHTYEEIHYGGISMRCVYFC